MEDKEKEMYQNCCKKCGSISLHTEVKGSNTGLYCALSKKYVRLEKVYDSVTNFVFIKTSLAKEIYEKLLERSIAIRYMGSYIRITAGSPEENAAVVSAIDEILEAMETEE